jgi:hypothetical protein
MIKKTHEQFLLDAYQIHNGKYKYFGEYKTSRTPLEIECPLHGVFFQSPNTHLKTRGCFKCRAKKPKKTHEKFLKEAREIHGDYYEYIEEYTGVFNEISISCPVHGVFKQRPHNHVGQKHGCPRCSNNGSSKSAKTWLDGLAIPHLRTFESPGGEYRIPGTRWRVDGYDVETNTVYEYHGTYWHGHPSHPEYSENEPHPTAGMTWKQLYDKTIERDRKIIDMGYNLVIFWQRR